MKSNYKRLGDCIQEVDMRNRSLEITNLIGLSIQKIFIPSISNTIGTDMSTYRIIQQDQFAYSPVTSRNGEKITIALYDKTDTAIISQAYNVFEIINKEILLPPYLMMWFRRPEFDRYARFKSHGSVREIFDWEEMCNVELPIPSLERQREIVAEYNTVQKRIDLNNQLIQKLEETAQAIYKQWFVDFEFPDENGKPYKSNGGEMVESELGEIPKGWRVGKLSDVIEVKYGKAYNHLSDGDISLYGSGGLMGYVNDVLYHKSSILIPRKGTLNNIIFLNKPFWCVDTMFYSILLNEFVGQYLFCVLKKIDFDALNQGSAVPSMTTEYLNSMQIIIPSDDILEKFNNMQNRTQQISESYNRGNNLLRSLQKLLLSRLATIEY
jgi:type I restriction enzyme S subunit